MEQRQEYRGSGRKQRPREATVVSGWNERPTRDFSGDTKAVTQGDSGEAGFRHCYWNSLR